MTPQQQHEINTEQQLSRDRVLFESAYYVEKNGHKIRVSPIDVQLTNEKPSVITGAFKGAEAFAYAH